MKCIYELEMPDNFNFGGCYRQGDNNDEKCQHLLAHEDFYGEWVEDCIFGGWINHCPIKRRTE